MCTIFKSMADFDKTDIVFRIWNEIREYQIL